MKRRHISKITAPTMARGGRIWRGYEPIKFLPAGSSRITIDGVE